MDNLTYAKMNKPFQVIFFIAFVLGSLVSAS